MLFYNFDMLDHLMKHDFIHHLKTEKETITKIIDLYHNKKNNLLKIINHMIDIADSVHKNDLDNFYEIVSLLKQSLEKIFVMEELLSKLEEELMLTITLWKKSVENNRNEIKANLVEYNKLHENLSYQILEFENQNSIILNTAIELSFNSKFKKKMKKQNKTFTHDFFSPTQKLDTDFKRQDNNVLIVSEKEQKAYLPFFYTEIKKIYENANGNYRTIQDVIDKLYILPLSRFKNSAIARFKESFHLIRDKENGSITQALDLGLELMFKYELNPIVIAACRNLDELDIYLDCLEENELQEFSCFEIKFQVMPKLTKKF